MQRLTLTFGLIVLAAVLVACSGVSAAPTTTDAPAATTAVPTDAVSIVAKDITFQQTQVAVPAGKPITIDFDNQDGAPHNIAIADASGAQVFKGDIVAGSRVTYSVPALAAGTYTFICEVHPGMRGTITAK